MSTPIHPLVEGIAIDDSYGVVGIAQLPKFRPNGSDQDSTIGAIFGTELYVPPPMQGLLRNQIITFAAS